MFWIPAEFEHVPQSDADVLQQFPATVRRTLRPDTAKVRREIGDGLVEIHVRSLAGKQTVQFLPQRGVRVHAPYHNVLNKWLTIPNLLTFVRILMTPFILIELSRGRYMAGGWMFGAAAFTDILDGALARAMGDVSKTGQYLDPIADKILLSCIYIGLALGGAVPVWIVYVIFARDLWILLLSAIALRFTSFRHLQPSVWGKASTFCQVMAVVAVTAWHAYGIDWFSSAANLLLGGVVILAAISGGDYSLRGILWARETLQRR